MDYIYVDNILRKHDLYDEANEKFRIRTLNDTGAKNIGLKYRIYKEVLNEKWIDNRNKRLKLIKSQGKCCASEKILENKSYIHLDCNFISSSNKEICKQCEFYQDTIKVIDESMNELRKAEMYCEKISASNYWG